MRPEMLAQSDHRLGRAEDEIAVGRKLAGEAGENVDLGRLVEIDQYIAAEDDVELAEEEKSRRRLRGRNCTMRGSPARSPIGRPFG